MRTSIQGQATPDNQSSSFPLNYSSTINFWPTLYSTIQKTNTYFQTSGSWIRWAMGADHVDDGAGAFSQGPLLFRVAETFWRGAVDHEGLYDE
jgi:hypothetical protein